MQLAEQAALPAPKISPTWQLVWAAWSTGVACEALIKRSATAWMGRIWNCIFEEGRADRKTCLLVGLDTLGLDVSGIYIGGVKNVR